MKPCFYHISDDDVCGKAGIGKPPLCKRHEKFRAEIEEDSGVGQELLDALFERPEVQKIVGQFSGLLDRVSGVIDHPQKVFRKGPRVPSHGARALEARTILGFGANEPLTEEKVKERKKALAQVFHPDLTRGNPEGMARVNAAADLLLSELSSKP